MAEESKKQILPPYIPYKTFINFINGLRETGIPHQIDKSVLRTMSGALQSATIASLKFLGLINDRAIPTQILSQLVDASSDNYNSVLKNVLTESYAFLLKNGLNIEQATGTQVEDKFREKGVSGSTITKCIAFFLAAAKDAKIKVSSHIRPPAIKRAPKSRKTDKSTLTKNGGSDEDSQNGDKTPRPQNQPDAQLGWYEQLLSKFPEFDPSWDNETKNSWFAAFNDLMKKGAQS